METRGRKPLPTATKPLEVNEELIRSDLTRIDQIPAMQARIDQNAIALAKDLAYDGALTVESLEEEIKFYQRRSVEAVLEMGKRLLLLKEVAGHGGFVTRIESLGIGERMAQRFMASTLKFSKASSTTLLTLPNLNQGKLLELLVLDDGEIEALNSGDEVRGIVLDDVDCMSVSELRRALRLAKADQDVKLAAKDKLLADKSRRITELVEDKNRREGLTELERHQQLEHDLTDATLLAIGSLIPMRKAVDAVRGLDHVPTGLYGAMQAAIHRVLTEAESIANDYGISLDFGLPTASLEDALATGNYPDPNAGEDFVEPAQAA
jgi:hypothetical protein